MAFCSRVVVEAPGKVNLSLNITGTKENGYHLMEMVMITVSLSDVLLIGRREEDEIRITSSSTDIPEDDTNIVHNAATRFFAVTGLPYQGLSIHIDKRLPVEAGLSGGSADAAAVLTGLNHLFETGLTKEQLCDIGLECGADVPFCIMGGCRLAQGIGEILTPLGELPACWLTIAKPGRGMSTPVAFQLYDEAKFDILRPNVPRMVEAISAGSLQGIGRNMQNVLQQVNPVEEVETLQGIMLCDGALGAVMTGSGTAVVGLFSEEKAAKRCAKHLRKQVDQTFVARPITHGARVIHQG